MKNKNQIKLEIDSLAFEGWAVGRNDGMVYLVKNCLPGDVVSVNIKRRKPNYIEANLLEILESSPDRIQPPCRYFGVCGGCSWQYMSYEKQLEWKQQHVIDAFERIGKIPIQENNSNFEFHTILKSPKDFNYRNKMEFSFGASRWLTQAEIDSDETIHTKNFSLGLHIPGRYDKILDLDSCLLQSEIGNKILREIKQAAIELEVSACDQVKHTGFLKNLIIRTSEKNQELMTVLITDDFKSESDKKFIEYYKSDLIKIIPEITSLVHAINNKITPVAVGDINFYFKKDYLIDSILDINYKISPFSFFQTNSSQLDGFILKILEFAEINSDSTVWDLFCGTGSITLPAAKKVKNILGIELSESSIADAKMNSKENNINNTEFITSDLNSKDVFKLLNQLPKPDVVIIDPPRAGMTINLIDTLLNLKIPKIVYVSCNPATQARDCNLLLPKYNIKKLQPVDMFPQTYHVESIAQLEIIS